MVKRIELSSEEYPGIAVQTITIDDIENLRLWKNRNRDSFFHKTVISPEEQKIWFEKYQQREQDFILMISYAGVNVGCIGFRVLGDVIDLYNVILGDEKFRSKGIMSKALNLLLDHLLLNYRLDITAKVLKTNPAITWYEKNGLKKTLELEDYYLVKFDRFTAHRSGDPSAKQG